MAVIHQYLDTPSLRNFQDSIEGGIQIYLEPNELECLRAARPDFQNLGYASITLCFDAIIEPLDVLDNTNRRVQNAVSETMNSARTPLIYKNAYQLGQYLIRPFTILSLVGIKNPFLKNYDTTSAFLASTVNLNTREKEQKPNARFPRIALRNFAGIDLVDVHLMLKEKVWQTLPDQSPNIPLPIIRYAEEVFRSELLFRYGKRTPYSSRTCDPELTLAHFCEALYDLPVLSRLGVI